MTDAHLQNNSATSEISTRSRVLEYLRLCRIGNVFTAFADVFMGYTVVSGTLAFEAPLVLLLIASGSLYTAGMVFNDWFDVEQDRQERPNRPIPSGAITRSSAARLGVSLLILGISAAGMASFLSESGSWTPIGVAALLTILIMAYNAGLKKTWLGPVAMGGCREGNVLLGMSLVVGGWHGWSVHHFTIAAAMGVFVAGITTMAKGEAKPEHRFGVLGGLILMIAGLGILASVYRQFPANVPLALAPEELWGLLLLLIAFPVFRRGLGAVIQPTPKSVQQAVVSSILTLVVLDASIALLLGGTMPAMVTLAMLGPAFLISHWISPT